MQGKFSLCILCPLPGPATPHARRCRAHGESPQPACSLQRQRQLAADFAQVKDIRMHGAWQVPVMDSGPVHGAAASPMVYCRAAWPTSPSLPCATTTIASQVPRTQTLCRWLSTAGLQQQLLLPVRLSRPHNVCVHWARQGLAVGEPCMVCRPPPCSDAGQSAVAARAWLSIQSNSWLM